jgi:RNA polymerase sigma factor (sigma-70 family)
MNERDEEFCEQAPITLILEELHDKGVDPAPAVDVIRTLVMDYHAREAAQQLFLSHLGTVERIAAFICRRNHMTDDETAELIAEVKLRLIENDYAILRKFEGRSTLPTYLTTVIQRIFNQQRIEMWGKWRPSAEAKRLGDKAVTLERMLTRDGYSYTEATQLLVGRTGSTYTNLELEAIYVRLPIRRPRPVLVRDGLTADAATDTSADDRLLARDRARTAETATHAIDAVMAQFDSEDQCILRMRFWEACKVPEIARRLQLDQKKLYKRIDKLLLTLRSAVEKAGVKRDAVEELLLDCGRA